MAALHKLCVVATIEVGSDKKFNFNYIQQLSAMPANMCSALAWRHPVDIVYDE